MKINMVELNREARNYNASIERVYDLEGDELQHILLLTNQPIVPRQLHRSLLAFIQALEDKLFKDGLPDFESLHDDWKNCFLIYSGTRWYNYKYQGTSPALKSKLPEVEAGAIVVIYKAAHLVVDGLRRLQNAVSATQVSEVSSSAPKQQSSSTASMMISLRKVGDKYQVEPEANIVTRDADSNMVSQIRAKRPSILDGLRRLRQELESERDDVHKRRNAIEETIQKINKPF